MAIINKQSSNTGSSQNARHCLALHLGERHLLSTLALEPCAFIAAAQCGPCPFWHLREIFLVPLCQSLPESWNNTCKWTIQHVSLKLRLTVEWENERLYPPVHSRSRSSVLPLLSRTARNWCGCFVSKIVFVLFCFVFVIIIWLHTFGFGAKVSSFSLL